MTIQHGLNVAPRGMGTREILHVSAALNMRRPVVTFEGRKLSYRFAADEALWIMSGSNRLEDLDHSSIWATFSDDGVTTFGAYGPPIQDQMGYVVGKLLQDTLTRQAVLTIWRQNPPPSKDIPCTVAMAFNIRRGLLNAHVFMRSSDLWLGLPYDLFTFTMVANQVAAHYNEKLLSAEDNFERRGVVVPGTLYWTAASCHIYERNVEDAVAAIDSKRRKVSDVPPYVFEGLPGLETLEEDLRTIRDGEVEERPSWIINTKQGVT